MVIFLPRFFQIVQVRHFLLIARRFCLFKKFHLFADRIEPGRCIGDRDRPAVVNADADNV